MLLLFRRGLLDVVPAGNVVALGDSHSCSDVDVTRACLTLAARDGVLKCTLELIVLATVYD